MDETSFSPQSIIWDMDGTIFDTERLIVDVWEEICDRNGYSNSRPLFLSCIGKNRRDARRMIFEYFGSDFPLDTLREERLRLVQEKIDELGDAFIKDGVREALEWATERKIPTALASSSDYERVIAHLDHMNLRKHFSTIVGGDQVASGKPDPEIFLAAAEGLGIAPERCVVIEDSHNGVVAAHAAGMHVLMIPDMVNPTEITMQHVHCLLASGKEITTTLSGLFYSDAD
jgi:HAD superfamily hydrolase (TIGR01509 family)